MVFHLQSLRRGFLFPKNAAPRIYQIRREGASSKQSDSLSPTQSGLFLPGLAAGPAPAPAPM